MNPKSMTSMGRFSIFKDGEKIGEIGQAVATIETAPIPYSEVVSFNIGREASIECELVIPPIIRKAAGVYRRTKSGRIKKKQLTRIMKENCGLFSLIPMRYFLQ